MTRLPALPLAVAALLGWAFTSPELGYSGDSLGLLQTVARTTGPSLYCAAVLGVTAVRADIRDGVARLTLVREPRRDRVWAAKAGATALLVTHDQQEAFAIGDQIGVMSQGQLHQWDDAYTLYHRPATRFVADFIGHGVFLPGTIVREGNRTVVRTPVGDLSDPDECALPCMHDGGLCDVLLRADDIVHDDASPVTARIVRKAFRGSEFLYTLQLATGETVLAHVPSHHDHKIGESIGIRAEVDHVVTFSRSCPHSHDAVCRMPCQHEPQGGQVIDVSALRPTSAMASEQA